ncbi:MAG: hypothetical protein QMC85_01375 [Methanocellales archaeon]|nr:hypothetical protein [Methanocellales archaeon]MDI6902694.1 hypothetical protein [Methanocellales archaeon]
MKETMAMITICWISWISIAALATSLMLPSKRFSQWSNRRIMGTSSVIATLVVLIILFILWG